MEEEVIYRAHITITNKRDDMLVGELMVSTFGKNFSGVVKNECIKFECTSYSLSFLPVEGKDSFRWLPGYNERGDKFKSIISVTIHNLHSALIKKENTFIVWEN